MTTKTFDAVATMRAIRARREEEFAGLSSTDRLKRIRARVAADPLWRRFAEAPAGKAAERGPSAPRQR